MQPITNDFSIHIATANGSGSQTSNMVLLRSMFQMGIPVSGKNLFPSNIAGLPTWFTVRVSRDGFIARRRDYDILVVMNPETAQEDLDTAPKGRVVILNEDIPAPRVRDDLIVYRVPMAKLVAPVTDDSRKRRLLANMVYVGVLAELLGIERGEVEAALAKQLRGKEKVVAMNLKAVDQGMEFARTHLRKNDPFLVERMDRTKGRIIIDGNTAAAIGNLFGGVTVVAWYPITPSSSLCESLGAYLKRFRHDPATGKATYAIVQCEDEIASIGTVLGAGWAGARAMTATSGPGISLMSELVGFGYFAEIPAVIWNVQRVGPSTGLPTRTAQGDILSTYFLSHGDTKHIMLFPSSCEECFTMAQDALDLAERFQTPVFPMIDLDLGMNYWMSDAFPWPERPLDRGKVLDAAALAKAGSFHRYRDTDGDGIGWRTLPGTNHPGASYFTRGSGHSESATYSEKPDVYRNLVDRLDRKFAMAADHVPAPVIEGDAGARTGIIGYGTSHWAIVEARSLLAARGLRSRYLRLRALPMNGAVRDFIASCDVVHVVEQNRDAQMGQLIRLAWPELATRIRSVLHYDGRSIDTESVVEGITQREGQ